MLVEVANIAGVIVGIAGMVVGLGAKVSVGEAGRFVAVGIAKGVEVGFWAAWRVILATTVCAAWVRTASRSGVGACAAGVLQPANTAKDTKRLKTPVIRFDKNILVPSIRVSTGWYLLISPYEQINRLELSTV